MMGVAGDGRLALNIGGRLTSTIGGKWEVYSQRW